jgi:hypothetical protein
MASQRSALPDRTIYEEFLAWCDENIWAEWVGRKAIILPSASLGTG